MRNSKTNAELRQGGNIARILGQLVKFGAVGASGIVVALIVINALMLCTGNFVAANLAAFFVAVTWNFFWNRRFTFVDHSRRPILKQWAMFVCSSLLGAVFNWTVTFGLYYGLVVFRTHYNLAVLCGVTTGYIANFIGAKCIVFQSKSNAS